MEPAATAEPEPTHKIEVDEPDGATKPKVQMVRGLGKSMKDASDVAVKPPKKRKAAVAPGKGGGGSGSQLKRRAGTSAKGVGKVAKSGGNSLVRMGEGRVGSGENRPRAMTMTMMDRLFVKTCLPKSMQVS